MGDQAEMTSPAVSNASGTAGPTEKSGRIFNRNYISMAITNCIYQSAHQMHFTILPLLLESIKASGTMIGLMTTLNVFAGMILRPVFGKQYDKRSKKALMVISLALVAISAGGISLSGAFQWLALIIAFRTLQGIGNAAVTTGGGSLVAEAVPRSRMAEAFGYYNAISISGTAFAPVLALFMIRKTGLVGSLWITAGFFAAAMLILSLFHRGKKTALFGSVSNDTASDEFADPASTDPKGSSAADTPSSDMQTTAAISESDTSDQDQYTGIWKYVEKAALPFALLVFLFFFSTCAASNFLVLYAEHSGFADISLYFAMSTVFILMARLVSEPLRRRWGERTVLIIGLISLSIGYLIITRMPSMTLLTAAGILVGLGTGLCNPMLMALCMSCAPASRYGIASSTYCLAIDLGYCISSTFWGAIVDFMGYSAAFMGATGLLVFSIVLCIPIFKYNSVSS